MRAKAVVLPVVLALVCVSPSSPPSSSPDPLGGGGDMPPTVAVVRSTPSAGATTTVRDARAYLTAAGDAAAGLYLDDTGDVVVRLVGRPRSRPPAGVVTEPATYSLRQLRDAADTAAARVGDALAEIAVDVRAGVVRLTPMPSRTDDVRRAVGADRRWQIGTEAPPARTTTAGSPLVGGGSTCTLGFTGSRRGVPVFLTAGHCGKAGTTFLTDGRDTGRLIEAVFPQRDYAMGLLRGGVRRGVVDTGATTSIPVTGSVAAPVGATVCSMGAASGWACGTVTATDVTVRYGEGDATQYVRGLTKVSLCRAAGDSGGPWLWGTQAQGLTSGGAGAHGPGCSGAKGEQAAYFQPVDPVLEATGVVLDVLRP